MSKKDLSKKDLNEQTIIYPELNKFPVEHIKYFFGPGKGMEKIAKAFGPIPKQNLHCFIPTIRVYTSCEIDNAKFKIQFYNINENGSPGTLVCNNHIIATAKQGRDYTIIDLRHLKIKYPVNGFFISVEWLHLEENEFYYLYKHRGKGERLVGMNYEPAIGAYPSDLNDTWVFNGQEWVQRENSKSILSDYDGKFRSLEIKVELGSRI
jgi:hypothetical protein